MDIVAQRVFSPIYIYLDIVFLVIFCGLLIAKKRYLTFLFAIFGGLLYMVVDYGIFHLLTHSRTIQNGDMFWVLLWMSLSYGITNFAWIWLWISKDKHLLEWSLAICIWWIAAPLISDAFTPSDMPLITIQRTTSSYHGYMAIILIVGYLACIIYNLFQRDRARRMPLLWMLAIGILVQFAWEFSLLIGGIRSATITDWPTKIVTLIVNSLLETNLGMPIIFPLYVLITSRYTENCKKRVGSVNFTRRIEEINELKVIR